MKISLIALLTSFGSLCLPPLFLVEAQEKANSVSKQSADEQLLVQGNNEFAFDLYARLAKKDGNIVFSPYSISTALAMTYAGARGETAKEMAKTLHFNLPDERLHQGFGELLRRVQKAEKPANYQLHVANALWGQQGFAFKTEFQELLKDRYGAVLSPVDFRDPQAARHTINQWVEKQTNKKIRDLISEDALGPLTRLVLTNAIYFQDRWELPFDKTATREKPFKLSLKDEVAVPMMHQMRFFRYGDLGNAQILELPYHGAALSMLVLLPRKVDGLPELEKLLTSKNFKTWREALVPSPERISSLTAEDLQALQEGRAPWTGIDVTMPRFEVTGEYSLAKDLEALGIKSAFSPMAADFTGMVRSTDDRLYITRVLHKATVEVDEQGTVAAAASAVAMGLPLSMPLRIDRTVSFRADHPFLYLIQDQRTGSILFLGRVVNPKS